MAVAFRNKSLVNTGISGDSTILPTPAGVVAGDRIYAVVASIASGPNVTGPAGWTKVSEYAPQAFLKSALYYRDATGSDAATYTWTWSANGRSMGMAVAYSGLDLTQAALGGSTGSTDSAAALQAYSFATPHDGDWAFTVAVGRENPGTDGAKSWTINDGSDAERHDSYSTNSGTGAKITGAWYDTNRALDAGTVLRSVDPNVELSQYHAWALRLAGPEPTDPGGPPTGVATWSYIGQPQR